METDTRKLFLKPNVALEPIINNWWAWSNLISPMTAPHFFAYHLKLMQSFVSSPKVHASALKNPAMRGGPFVNLAPEKVDEVRKQIEEMLRSQAHMLAFADAIKSLDGILLGMGENRGMSLEPMYEKVPEPLKGYVELVYDLNNQPSIRFFEGLLYKSQYYQEALQSIVLREVQGDERPFFNSTPRLPSEDVLKLDIPFRSEGFDELVKMRAVPQTIGYISEKLGVPTKDMAKFSTLFSETSSDRPSKYTGDGVRIRYQGHACLLIETKKVSILVDPMLSYKVESGIDRFTFGDLPEVLDYVFITHNHQDHFYLESLLQIRHKVKTVVIPRSAGGTLADPSLRMILSNIGFKNIVELDVMESLPLEGGGEVVGLPFMGEHGDLNISSKIVHLLKLEKYMLATDTRNIEPTLYKRVHDLVGDVDVMFLGLECEGAPISWLCGPLFTRPLPRKMDDGRRLTGSDGEKAISIVERFNPTRVYIYAMGQEPWLRHLMSLEYNEQSPQIIASNQLVEYCSKKDIKSERLFGKAELTF